jgi:DNA repair exonuclease SbcCD ATPase subunit
MSLVLAWLILSGPAGHLKTATLGSRSLASLADVCVQDCNLRRRNGKLRAQNQDLKAQVLRLTAAAATAATAAAGAHHHHSLLLGGGVASGDTCRAGEAVVDPSNAGQERAELESIGAPPPTSGPASAQLQSQSQWLRRLEKQQKELIAANSRIDKLLSLQNAVTRKSDREAKAKTTLAKRVAELETEVATLDGKLKASATELAYIKRQLRHQQQLAKTARGSAGASAKSPPGRVRAVHALQVKLEKARERIEALAAGKTRLKQRNKTLNTELRHAQKELNSLDPTFFEEVEDLKCVSCQFLVYL